MLALHKNSSPFSEKFGWVAAGIGVALTAYTIYKEITKYNLKGRVVLITGGSRGLGLALARKLAAKGAKLVICSRSPEQLQKARIDLEERGAEVLAINANVGDRGQVKNLIQATVDHFGKIDVLINNAGIVQVGPYDTMSIEDYEEAMRIHFWAPLYAIMEVLPHFKTQGDGRIMNITSIGGKIAVPHLLPYTASKFALVGLSEGLHAELKKQNIHVTTVVPNLTRTGSPRNVTVKGDHEREYALFKRSGSHPLISQSADVAARSIVRALEYGDSEVILSLTGKMATFMKGFAPGWMNALFAMTNRFLPDSIDGSKVSKRGYEAESKLSYGPLTAITDRAAKKYNEI